MIHRSMTAGKDAMYTRQWLMPFISRVVTDQIMAVLASLSLTDLPADVDMAGMYRLSWFSLFCQRCLMQVLPRA